MLFFRRNFLRKILSQLTSFKHYRVVRSCCLMVPLNQVDTPTITNHTRKLQRIQNNCWSNNQRNCRRVTFHKSMFACFKKSRNEQETIWLFQFKSGTDWMSTFNKVKVDLYTECLQNQQCIIVQASLTQKQRSDLIKKLAINIISLEPATLL